jgi:hypothetical protein
MEFLTEEQARQRPFTTEYRYPTGAPLAALIVFFAITAACAAGALKAWTVSAWIGTVLLGWCALWFGLFTLIANKVWRSRRRPTNWLVRVNVDGPLIQYRSYLNHHFPAEERTVAFVPFSEIAWARAHRVERNMPESADEDTTRGYRYVELQLSDDDARTFADEIEQERRRSGPERLRWFGRTRSKSSHYPVQVVRGSLLRMDWSVRPKAPGFLAEIGAFVAIHSAIGSDVDFRRIEEMSAQEQEQHLFELLETGDRINATKIVRRLYNLDTTKAVQFLNDLEGRKQ